MRNWGAYVKNLNSAGADSRVTGLIEHVRKLYRNPVFHAEDNVSPEQAQILLGACVSLMCQIMMLLPGTVTNLQHDNEQHLLNGGSSDVSTADLSGMTPIP